MYVNLRADTTNNSSVRERTLLFQGDTILVKPDLSEYWHLRLTVTIQKLIEVLTSLTYD